MSTHTIRSIFAFAAAIPLASVAMHGHESRATLLPVPAYAGSATAGAEATAVLAGGCFWGVEAVFEHVDGVIDVVSGYAGGSIADPPYELVSTGLTGHAESVRITFEPSRVSYAELLRVFFSVAHDPTQLNRQGPAVGTQYRSAIFYADAEQERVARAYIAELTRAGAFSRPIVTEVEPLEEFFVAEAYHQDYLAHHPNDLYIVINDQPKLERLREQFPAMYRDPS